MILISGLCGGWLYIVRGLILTRHAAGENLAEALGGPMHIICHRRGGWEAFPTSSGQSKSSATSARLSSSRGMMTCPKRNCGISITSVSFRNGGNTILVRASRAQLLGNTRGHAALDVQAALTVQAAYDLQAAFGVERVA